MSERDILFENTSFEGGVSEEYVVGWVAATAGGKLFGNSVICSSPKHFDEALYQLQTDKKRVSLQTGFDFSGSPELFIIERRVKL